MGAVARRVPLARPLTVLAQAVVTLLLLTFVCARGQAVLGIIPGPQALQRLGAAARPGRAGRRPVRDPGAGDPGHPAAAGGRHGAGGAGGGRGGGDLPQRRAGRAAAAGAVLGRRRAWRRRRRRWLWFLCAASGYLLLLLAEGRDRLSRWGRVFSGAPAGARGLARCRRRARTSGRPIASLRSGRRIGVMALGIALLAPAVLPAMDSGLLGTAGGSSGLGRGGGTISAVNPLVSLQDSLNQPEDREVLRYRTITRRHLRHVSADRGPRPVRRHLVEGLGTEGHQRPGTAARSRRAEHGRTGQPGQHLDHRGPRLRAELPADALPGHPGAGQPATGATSRRAAPWSATGARPPPGSSTRWTACRWSRPHGSCRTPRRRRPRSRQEYTQVPRSLPAVVRTTAQQVTQGVDRRLPEGRQAPELVHLHR